MGGYRLLYLLRAKIAQNVNFAALLFLSQCIHSFACLEIPERGEATTPLKSATGIASYFLMV